MDKDNQPPISKHIHRNLGPTGEKKHMQKAREEYNQEHT